MVTAQAHIETQTPTRYVTQLCRHLNHRAKTHPELGARIEWSDDRGTADFGWGRCLIDAGAGVLTLRAEAADEADLEEVELMIGGMLERMGRHERLVVTWETHRDEGTLGPPSSSSETARTPNPARSHRPGRHLRR